MAAITDPHLARDRAVAFERFRAVFAGSFEIGNAASAVPSPASGTRAAALAERTSLSWFGWP